MDQKAYNFINNIIAACKEYDGKPEAAFVRGKVGSGLKKREALVMLVGPQVTLENIATLRKEIKEALDAKEAQLLGNIGPDTAVVFY